MCDIISIIKLLPVLVDSFSFSNFLSVAVLMSSYNTFHVQLIIKLYLILYTHTHIYTLNKGLDVSTVVICGYARLLKPKKNENVLLLFTGTLKTSTKHRMQTERSTIMPKMGCYASTSSILNSVYRMFKELRRHILKLLRG